MNVRYIFLVIFCLASLIACQEEDLLAESDGLRLEDFTHYFNQTGCADPWLAELASTSPTTDRDVAYIEAASTYLKNNDIEVIAIKLVHPDEPQASCLACVCTTGSILYVKVDEKDGNKLLALGEGEHEKWKKL